MKLYVGQKWAYLEVESIQPEYMEIPDGPGCMIKGTFSVATLSCNCGGTKKIIVSEFPGQAEMKDCGCGKAADFILPRRGRPRSPEPKRLTSLFIEEALHDRVRDYANQNNLTVGRAMCELMALGLAATD